MTKKRYNFGVIYLCNVSLLYYLGDKQDAYCLVSVYAAL